MYSYNLHFPLYLCVCAYSIEARSRTDPTGHCLQAPGADRARLFWFAPGRRLLR